jgi:ribosomal protein L7/L12
MAYSEKSLTRQLLSTVTISVGAIRIEIASGATPSRSAKTAVFARHRASNGRFASVGSSIAAAPKLFDVVLLACGEKKLEVVREARHFTEGLKEAKDLVECAPAPIIQGVNRVLAEQIGSDFEKAGATVEIRASHSGNGQFHPAYAAASHAGRAAYGAYEVARHPRRTQPAAQARQEAEVLVNPR